MRFRSIKPEIRVVGIDDGVFVPHTKGSALVIGVVFRGGLWLDGVMHTKVTVDGMDANERLASMIVSSPHFKQLRVIMLNGVTCAGFNVVDIKRLNEDTSLPVIAVTRKKPNYNEIYAALKHLPNSDERWAAMQRAGELFAVPARGKRGKIFVHVAGIAAGDAEQIVQKTATRSDVPEPLRVAHLIASGVSESIV
ncbi:MAG: DUF99 family protein [Candidatus Bathyarchaeia archaeon]